MPRRQAAARAHVVNECRLLPAEIDIAAILPWMRRRRVVAKRHVAKASPYRPHCKAVIPRMHHRAAFHKDVGMLPVDVDPIRPGPVHPHIPHDNVPRRPSACPNEHLNVKRVGVSKSCNKNQKEKKHGHTQQ